jgi:hypothetical protein
LVRLRDDECAEPRAVGPCARSPCDAVVAGVDCRCSWRRRVAEAAGRRAVDTRSPAAPATTTPRSVV